MKTNENENPSKPQGTSDLQEESTQRQISIAPMMDWTSIDNKPLKTNSSKILVGNM